jgi:error-prone DNA polymerase
VHWVSEYAEQHCHANFSFLDGASHPEDLVETAVALGYQALAVADQRFQRGSIRLEGV